MARKEYFLICSGNSAKKAYRYRTYKYIDIHVLRGDDFRFLKREEVHFKSFLLKAEHLCSCYDNRFIKWLYRKLRKFNTRLACRRTGKAKMDKLIELNCRKLGINLK